MGLWQESSLSFPFWFNASFFSVEYANRGNLRPNKAMKQIKQEQWFGTCQLVNSLHANKRNELLHKTEGNECSHVFPKSIFLQILVHCKARFTSQLSKFLLSFQHLEKFKLTTVLSFYGCTKYNIYFNIFKYTIIKAKYSIYFCDSITDAIWTLTDSELSTKQKVFGLISLSLEARKGVWGHFI